MSKVKYLIIFILLGCITIGIFFYYKYAKLYDYNENIKIYSEFLKKEPNNCFYNQQIAANYSFLKNFDEAIKHYEFVRKNCPEDLVSLFQLGVCYYMKMNKDIGLKFMDEAIEKAKAANDNALELRLKKEKFDWIKNRNLIKESD